MKDTKVLDWNTDCWKPGSPVYDHYHSKSFKAQRTKGFKDIETQWITWLEEHEYIDADLSDLYADLIPAPIEHIVDVEEDEITKEMPPLNTSYHFIIAICCTLAIWTALEHTMTRRGKEISFFISTAFVIANLYGWYYVSLWLFGGAN